jgi:hypothetical protein
MIARALRVVFLLPLNKRLKVCNLGIQIIQIREDERFKCLWPFGRAVLILTVVTYNEMFKFEGHIVGEIRD